MITKIGNWFAPYVMTTAAGTAGLGYGLRRAGALSKHERDKIREANGLASDIRLHANAAGAGLLGAATGGAAGLYLGAIPAAVHHIATNKINPVLAAIPVAGLLAGAAYGAKRGVDKYLEIPEVDLTEE